MFYLNSMIMLLLFSFFVSNMSNLLIYMSFSFLLLLMLINLSFMYDCMNYMYMYMDYISYLMLFLTYMIVFFIFIMKYNKMNLMILFNLNMMIMSLFMCFISNNLLFLYIFFEISLVPLIILILILGGSMERFKASMYLLVYTLLGSFLLFLCLFHVNSSLIIGLESYFYFKKNFSVFWGLMLLVFLVKVPFFGLHLWLPKAHVEGPVSCSILLAGILLKLGGFGLIRMFIFLNLNKMKLLLMLILVFSILGAVFISIICVRQVDVKILIAYSSISHMGLMLGGLFSLSMLGVSMGVCMMLAHGFCSSGLFFMGNMFYERCKTRNMMMFKGWVTYFPLMMVYWLLYSIFNMGSPPSMNFYCEILLVLSVVNKSFIFLFLLMILMFLNVFYSLNLYLRASHGTSWEFLMMKKETFLEKFVLLGLIMFLIMYMFMFKLFIYF